MIRSAPRTGQARWTPLVTSRVGGSGRVRAAGQEVVAPFAISGGLRRRVRGLRGRPSAGWLDGVRACRGLRGSTAGSRTCRLRRSWLCRSGRRLGHGFEVRGPSRASPDRFRRPGRDVRARNVGGRRPFRGAARLRRFSRSLVLGSGGVGLGPAAAPRRGLIG
jgi:hypothetical protein